MAPKYTSTNNRNYYLHHTDYLGSMSSPDSPDTPS
jgi:hypothetical protein